jgi:hypothetical protein
MDKIATEPSHIANSISTAGIALTPVAKSWAKRTALLGALTFILLIGMYFLPDFRAAQTLCGHAPDIVGFELSRTPADIERVFADMPSGCRAATVRAMDTVNHIDLPWFMIIYAAFMASAALFQSAKWQQRRWLWGLLATAIALIGDIIETGMLLRITENLSDFSSSSSALMIGTWMKWLGIAGLAGLTAALTLRHNPRRWLIGAISLVATLATLMALFSHVRFGAAMALLLTLHWLALWMDALRALRQR